MSTFRHLRHVQFAKLFFGKTSIFGPGIYVVPNVPGAGIKSVVSEIEKYTPSNVVHELPSRNPETSVHSVLDVHKETSDFFSGMHTTVVLLEWFPDTVMQCLQRLSEEPGVVTFGVHHHEKDMFKASDQCMLDTFNEYRPAKMNDDMFTVWKDCVMPSASIPLVTETSVDCSHLLNLDIGLTLERIHLNTLGPCKQQHRTWSQFYGTVDEDSA